MRKQLRDFGTNNFELLSYNEFDIFKQADKFKEPV